MKEAMVELANIYKLSWGWTVKHWKGYLAFNVACYLGGYAWYKYQNNKIQKEYEESLKANVKDVRITNF